MVPVKNIQIFKMKLKEILEEQNYPILKVSRNKVLVDAIVNRHPITFYYSGPRKPKKKSVKAGYRVKAEAVALGAHKNSGNLVVRAYIDDPSASKRGTPTKVGKVKSNYGWRTFLASRMSNVQVLKNETFNTIREKYNGGGDDQSMSITYVSTDFSQTPPKPKIGDTKQAKPAPAEPTKPPTITKQTRDIDSQLKSFDRDLEQVEKDIQKSLEDYKKTKNSPDEIKYVEQLKSLNKKKDELLTKIADTIGDIGKDVDPEDKSKINNFTNRVSRKKKDLDIIVPTPTKKPTKSPNKPDEPESSEQLPKVKPKEKPEEDSDKYNLSEGFINRIKKLIIYN